MIGNWLHFIPRTGRTTFNIRGLFGEREVKIDEK
jgi:hypothetical protein